MTPTTLNDLFQLKADEITDEQVMLMVKGMRQRRALWEADEATKAGEGRRQTRQSSGAAEKIIKTITLDDIMGGG